MTMQRERTQETHRPQQAHVDAQHPEGSAPPCRASPAWICSQLASAALLTGPSAPAEARNSIRGVARPRSQCAPGLCAEARWDAARVVPGRRSPHQAHPAGAHPKSLPGTARGRQTSSSCLLHARPPGDRIDSLFTATEQHGFCAFSGKNTP